MSAPATEFDLRALVYGSLDRSSDADPHKVALHIADTLPSKHLRAALRMCLPPLVVTMVGVERRRRVRRSAPKRPGVGSNGAVDAMAAIYASYLADRLPVANGWKIFGECEKADLLYAAEVREKHAEGCLVQATRYRRLAKAMKLPGEKVKDLPPTLVLKELTT